MFFFPFSFFRIPCSYFTSYYFFSFFFLVYLMQSVGTHFIRFGIRCMRASVLVAVNWWWRQLWRRRLQFWCETIKNDVNVLCVIFVVIGSDIYFVDRYISTHINNAKFTHQRHQQQQQRIIIVFRLSLWVVERTSHSLQTRNAEAYQSRMHTDASYVFRRVFKLSTLASKIKKIEEENK